MELTQGHLLDGRLSYAQPMLGYRTGIEPVLLAASVPARPGDRVLEAGTGAGAGLLCLLFRVSGVLATGVELDAAMADLARCNLRRNGFAAAVLEGDVRKVSLAGFDHAFANPPWHHPRATPSPNPARRRAKQAGDGELEAWTGALAAALRPGGTLTLVLAAAAASRAAAAMQAAGLGEQVTTSLLPKLGRPAKIVLIQARRGACGVLPARDLVLHEAEGAFTPAVEAMLRDGAAMASK